MGARGYSSDSQPMLIDLHAHTWPRSHDSVLNPDDLIVRAKQAGLDAIAFTEHDTVWDQKSIEELRAKHNFLVLAGIEISTDDGHILSFGIDKYVFGMHRSRELASYVEKSDGVMVAAHPYRRQMPWFSRDEDEYQAALEKASRNPAYQFVQALEEVNGRGSEKENEFSRRLCDMMNLGGTGGTDSHAISDIGKCATYFERPVRDERELIAELKAGRFYAVDLRSGQPVRSRP
ncbi:MAG: PHP domain-containing protein [Thermoflexaceae bacterium]|nr:PHP domain-containing protein [Thermoflexaceae bacterium]